MKHIIFTSIFIVFALCAFAQQTAVPARPAPPTEEETARRNASLDSLNNAKMLRLAAASSRKNGNPVIFLVGNSTMRQGTRGNGDIGQWGWGFYFQDMFDTDKVTVENQALGGMSSRSYYRDLWKDVLKGVQKGDYVFIELGHNDNGGYDNGKASLKGIGRESVVAMVKQFPKRGEPQPKKPLKDKKETVYSFGEYLRKYIADVRAKGATPVLLSLVPRNRWTDDGRFVRDSETFALWTRQIAEEQGVAFIDMNELCAAKFEKFGKAKTDYMFYGDGTHTSAFGAKENCAAAIDGIRNSPNLKFIADCIKGNADAVKAGTKRQKGKPVVFTIGDSTVRNNDSDTAGMWGWGSVIQDYFDLTKCVVDNQAMAGRSARTYLDEGRWDRVYDALQPGDVVLIQFGHNDGGPIGTPPARGELRGNGDSTRIVLMQANRRNQVIYTYGWYIRKFVGDAIEKGAIPVVLSHTPRNQWTEEGKVVRNNTSYGLWAKEAAGDAGGYFIDLNEISAVKLEKAGKDKDAVADYFKNDHTHTSLKGAHLNAQSIVKGIRQLQEQRVKELLK